jgi:hypothetical protein
MIGVPDRRVRARQPRSSATSERSDGDTGPDAHSGGRSLDGLAEQLRSLRTALLDLIEELPETRLYRATDRLGWTIKHELSSLAAADEELEHVLERLREGPAHAELQLRRFRGERMWVAQELRLTPLREHLAATGERALAAVEAHAQELADEPLSIAGRELASARDYLEAHLAAAQRALRRIGEAME